MLMQKRQTDPNPPPEKPTRTKTRNEKNTEPATERRKKKKNTGAGRGLGEGENEEVRVEVGVRVQEEESQGESQTPHGVWVSPAPEREREKRKKRQREKRRRRTHQAQRKREGTTNIWADKGQVLKGEKTRQQSNPRDKKHHTEYPTSIPEKPNKNQIQNQQSLGGFVTAGWRGPWAALHSWGVTPGDRSTEGYKYPPTTGTAPGGAKSGHIPNTRQIPQKSCPSTWPFRYCPTRPQVNKQTPNENSADIQANKDAQGGRHYLQTLKLAGTLPGGNHAEVAGLLPPTYMLQPIA